MARLTIPDEATSADFTVTTEQSVFPFSFAIFEKADLRVTANGLNVDQSAFTFAGTRLEGGGYQGGAITLNTPVTSGTVRVWRRIKPVRPSNFSSQASVPVRSVDMEFNKIVAQQQDVMLALEDVEAGVVDPDVLAGVVEGATQGKADSTGGNLTPMQGQAFRFAIGDRTLRPEDYRQDGDVSWVEAIERMEADANPNDVCRFNPRVYDLHRTPGEVLAVSGKRGFERQGMAWVGNNTEFRRSGGDTTTDILAFMGETVQLKQCHFEGFTVRSDVQMTGDSAAIHFKNFCRSSVVRVNPGGQDDPTNAGLGFLKHGVWFDMIDEINYSQFVGMARAGDAVRVNGQAGSGPKAGLKIQAGKLGGSKIGLHIGGAFGGIYTEGVDIAVNERGVVIDQSIVNEYNREVMFSPNVSVDKNDLCGILIDQDDARLFVNLGGMWIASTDNGPGLHVKRCINGRILVDAYFYQNGQDGIYVEAPYSFVYGNPFCVNNGLNAPPAGPHPGWFGVRAADDPLVNGLDVEVGGYSNGNFGTGDNYLYAPNRFHRRRATNQHIADLTFARGGPDEASQSQIVSGKVRRNFDVDDYEEFDREQNTLELRIGAGDRASRIYEGGFWELGADSVPVKPKTLITTTNGSGALSVPHGITSGQNRIVSATAAIGAVGAAKASISLGWDGVNAGVPSTGYNNTRAVVTIWYAKNDV